MNTKKLILAYAGQFWRTLRQSITTPNRSRIRWSSVYERAILVGQTSASPALFDEALNKSFYGRTRPISDRFAPEALAVSGFSREQHLTFDDPKTVMEKFAAWLDDNSKGRPVLVSHNLAFDWQSINYYFHRFLGQNPFGFSGRRIGDLYAGLVKDAYKATEWKKYRVTRHTHNPVDDARGNAEALNKFKELGLNI